MTLWADYTETVKETAPQRANVRGHDTEGVASMQNQHTPRWAAWLTRSLLLTAALAVAWAIVAGANGYQLGSAPTGLAAVPCAKTLRVDFVVPMWKAADPSDCAATSSGAAPAPAPVQAAPAPAPAAPAICDDPNAPADGNTSGERACP